MLSATASLMLAFAPAAEPLQAAHEGRWVAKHNPYRSAIELSITRDTLTARIGCTGVGTNYQISGATVRRKGILVVQEAACVPSEKWQAAEYWRGIVAVIRDIATLKMQGEQLWLVDRDGRVVVFRRAGDGRAVP